MDKTKVIEFQKYKIRGAYHWEQISSNIFKRNTFILGRYNNMIQLVKNKVGILQDKKILDVGCGDGVLSYLLSKQGANVSGIDYSVMAIEFANEKTRNSKIDYRQGSAYELPFSDNSFDIVVSSDVIEHLKDVPLYLAEINRVSRNDAVIVISTPVKFTELPLDPEHVVEWFPNEFKCTINNQFQVSEFYYSHSLVMHELLQAQIFGKRCYNVLLNILSFFYNPFNGFNVKFKHKALQYAVVKVVK
jgi:ubiquinone biosynthesis O-methyltransferase